MTAIGFQIRQNIGARFICPPNLSFLLFLSTMLFSTSRKSHSNNIGLYWESKKIKKQIFWVGHESKLRTCLLRICDTTIPNFGGLDVKCV